MAKQSGMTLSALRSRLARGMIAPVYLLAGVEPFLADEAVRAITETLEPEGGKCARSLYHGDEADVATVLGDVRNLDLFSPTRLAVVSPADQLVERHGAALGAYASAPASNGHLILVVAKVDARKKLAKAVQKAGGLVACNQLYGRDIVPWIMARVKAMKLQIDSAAAARLAEFLGTDLSALAGELDKLATYLGDAKRITVGHVEAVSLRDRGRIIYDLTDAVGRREAAQVLTVLNSLLERGDKPAKALFWVARHMRKLWAAKELIDNGMDPKPAAQQLGERFFVEKFLAQVGTFTRRELRENCSALTKCEMMLKTSRMDDRTLLETTFLKLVRRPQRSGTA